MEQIGYALCGEQGAHQAEHDHQDDAAVSGEPALGRNDDLRITSHRPVTTPSGVFAIGQLSFMVDRLA
jgi:hypothetical protein